jgi:hypothetical protein
LPTESVVIVKVLVRRLFNEKSRDEGHPVHEAEILAALASFQINSN